MVLLVADRGLHQLHCRIAPKAHMHSMREADPSLLQEVDLWKAGLIRMLRAVRSRSLPDGLECVFVETRLRAQQHTSLECIPIPLDLISSLPMYLRKAILESGEMWATNPKLVESFDKRVHHVVPEGFPYIHFEWSRDRERGGPGSELPKAVGGYMCIVEDERGFDKLFARRLIGGMQDMDEAVMGKLQYEDDAQIQKKVAKFTSLFRNFDWTRVLQ